MMHSFRVQFSLIFSFFLIGLVVLGAVSFVHAQTATSTDANPTTSGITFPIPDLGNCADKDSCRAYCNAPAHMDACIAFAKAHGLMNSNDANRAQQFKKDLERGAGPGGCATPDSCKAFCSDVKNLDMCVTFAKQHGAKGDDIDRASKLSDYIAQGGQTPGGCTSADSCKHYCSDSTHATECLAFAKTVGVAGKDQDQLQKFASLVAAGQTPGGCNSKDTCEAYCKDPSHRDVCIAFGQQMGFVSVQQAQSLQANGFKGPGGCDSKDACEAYCNDSAHQNECFAFADRNGVLKHGDVEDALNGSSRLRAGLDDASSSVTECLKSTLGQNIINNIQSGTFAPGPEIGQQVKGCFQNFGQSASSSAAFRKAPPQVAQCLKDKGFDVLGLQSGTVMTTPEMGDALRVCAETVRIQEGGSFGGQKGSSTLPVSNFLRQAPSSVLSCLKEKLGDQFEALQSGSTAPTPDLEQAMKSCFESFRPQMPMRGGDNSMSPGGMMASGTMPGTGGERSGPKPNFPSIPTIDTACLKQILGEDGIAQLRSGGAPSQNILDAIRKCAGGGTSGSPQNFMPGQNASGSDHPLFKKEPYLNAVPFLNTYPSGTYQHMPRPDQPPSGGPYPNSDQYQSPSGTMQKPPPPPPGANLLEIFKPFLFFQK